MSTVDFTRESSSGLRSHTSTSQFSSKAQKESYNAFLVSGNGGENSDFSGKGDFQEYSLSNHFSSDSSPEENTTTEESNKTSDDSDLREFLSSHFSFPVFLENLPEQQNIQIDIDIPSGKSPLKMGANNPQLGTENSSTKVSDGKSVLPEGLQSVAPEKAQQLVQQLVSATAIQNGTLDAQKSATMYRPISSTDLGASKKVFSESTLDVRGVLRPETAQAITAADRGEQRQDSSAKDDSQEQKQQDARSPVLSQQDIQSRMGPAALAQVEQQTSTATATQLRSMEDLNPVIMDHMDRLQKSQQKQLKVKMELPDGEILSLQLKLEGGAVHVRFESGSEELLNSLAEGWGALEDAAHERGVVMAKPHFETSSSQQDALYTIADNSKSSAYSNI